MYKKFIKIMKLIFIGKEEVEDNNKNLTARELINIAETKLEGYSIKELNAKITETNSEIEAIKYSIESLNKEKKAEQEWKQKLVKRLTVKESEAKEAKEGKEGKE